jgi:hypothetical protein
MNDHAALKATAKPSLKSKRLVEFVATKSREEQKGAIKVHD